MENAQQTNKKLNIAFIIYRFGQNVGGAERVAHELSKRIIARGHELHIFSYSFHDVTNITAVFHTVPITKNPYFYRRYSFACNVRDILKDYNFDVTQSFGRTFGCDIYRFGSGIHSKYLETTKKSLLSKMLARVNPKHILENKLEKESMKPNSFKILVAVSNIEKAALVQKYNIPENKIIVVHNGVDTQRFHPRNKELYREKIRREFGIETSFNILFCGSGFHRKGLDQTLHVLNNLTKRHVDTSLLVVGKGDIQKFQSLARKMGISNRILFLGHRIHVEKYYSVSDILVLPTLFDPFPNTCLEAMSNGLPVITTKHTGISEIIDDGKDSFIIPSADNILQITDIITNLYKNRPLLDEISNSARLKAEKYDWESVTNKYIDIYHKIADSQVLAGR